MPKFSIIIPIYNIEDYIVDCLNSILRQSFHNYEIVCINDGSTDSSGEIVKEYKEKHCDKILYIEQQNGGLSIARNVGLSASKGEYVCFLDGDDMLTDNALEVLNSVLENNKDIEIINYEMSSLLFDGVEVDDAKRSYYRIDHQYNEVQSGVDMLISMIENHDYVESANLLLINRIWLNTTNIRFTPSALYEDSIFSIDCFLNCKKMIHLNEGLYIYRVRYNSIMTAKFSFMQLRWRIWQYREVLRRICLNYSNALLEQTLSEYAKLVLGSIKVIYRGLNYWDRQRVLELKGLDGLIVSTLGLEKNIDTNEKLKLNGLLRKIEKADGIIVYGAGYIGNKICKIIDNLDVDHKIKSVVVTFNNKEMSVNGHKVESVDSCDMSGVDLVIIATVKNHKEMIEKIGNYTDADIITIDSEFWYTIDKYIGENLNDT